MQNFPEKLINEYYKIAFELLYNNNYYPSDSVFELICYKIKRKTNLIGLSCCVYIQDNNLYYNSRDYFIKDFIIENFVSNIFDENFIKNQIIKDIIE